jgi:hypothetical protein
MRKRHSCNEALLEKGEARRPDCGSQRAPISFKTPVLGECLPSKLAAAFPDLKREVRES